MTKRRKKKANSRTRQRLPSQQEAWRLLSICIVPIHLWALVQLLRDVSPLALRMTIWDLIGVTAYSQAFALVESVYVAVILLLLAVSLPAFFIRKHLVEQAFIIIVVSAIWAIIFHYNLQGFIDLRWSHFVLLTPVYLLSVFFPSYLVRNNRKWLQFISDFAERMTTLATVYVVIGAFSLLIVIGRNIL